MKQKVNKSGKGERERERGGGTRPQSRWSLWIKAAEHYELFNHACLTHTDWVCQLSLQPDRPGVLHINRAHKQEIIGHGSVKEGLESVDRCFKNQVFQ